MPKIGARKTKAAMLVCPNCGHDLASKAKLPPRPEIRFPSYKTIYETLKDRTQKGKSTPVDYFYRLFAGTYSEGSIRNILSWLKTNRYAVCPTKGVYLAL